MRTFAPRLAAVISQGVREGVFDVRHAEYAAEIIMETGSRLGGDFARVLSQGGLSGDHKETVLALEYWQLRDQDFHAQLNHKYYLPFWYLLSQMPPSTIWFKVLESE